MVIILLLYMWVGMGTGGCGWCCLSSSLLIVTFDWLSFLIPAL